MGLATLIAIALAGVVWSYGTYITPGGGMDGPCLGPSNFTADVREGSNLKSEWSWLPPRQRCVEERSNGTRREQLYPGRVTFALAGAALVLPFAFRRAARIVPRASSA